MTTDVTTMSYTELFDHLQSTLGVPAFGVSGEPYYKWRLRQIAALRRTMTRQGISVDEALVCADYVRSHKHRALTYDGFFRHLHEAKSWEKLKSHPEVLEQEIENAIAYERALSGGVDTEWVRRLVRAQPNRRLEVLAEWQDSQK